MNGEKVWNDTKLSDFDLLKGIVQLEYGNNSFSNSGELTDTGDYNIVIDRDGEVREIDERKRVNHVALRRILKEPDTDFVFSKL